MTIIARLRVVTRASGRRRQVYVHVYIDQAQMARAHTEARGREYDPADEIGGGMATQTSSGFTWPWPDSGPVLVIRLWTGQLTTHTIAHEATHAGAVIYFLDSMAGWDSLARGILLGNHEPMAYAVGDISSEIIAAVYPGQAPHVTGWSGNTPGHAPCRPGSTAPRRPRARPVPVPARARRQR